jgi:squalene cyclase
MASAARSDVPPKYKAAVQKGLDWLVKQQRPDGTWAALGNQYPTPITAFAGLALLAEGSTTDKGKYAENLRKARDWLIKNAQKGNADDGLIGNRHNPDETPRYMFGHGYGMLFLSSLCAEEENRHSRNALKDVLNRAVQFTVTAQSSKGGWFYTSARDGHDSDEGATTVCQIQGLLAARKAGIPVPKATLQKARAFLAKNTGPGGGLVYASTSPTERPALTAAAVACAFCSGEFTSEGVKRWLKYCQTTMPLPTGGRLGNEEFTHFYYAQVIFALGEKGFEKLFPKATERLQWSGYRDKMFEQLLKSQKEDGSWTSYSAGPAYSTALSLVVLQMDNEAIPILNFKVD